MDNNIRSQEIPPAEEDCKVSDPTTMSEKQDVNGPLSNSSFVSFEHQSDQTSNGKSWDTWRYVEIFCAEFFGTALLMSVGCMGTVSSLSPNGISSLQAGLTFGMVVATLIQIFGHISAAHFNPAVTACFFMLGDVTSILELITYLAAEVSGATAGLAFLKVLTPTVEGNETCLCCTLPHSTLNEVQAFGVEFLATSCLILLVCALCDPRNEEKQDSAPIKFGLLIIAVSFAAGPYTGASMNPARSLAPAIVNNTWTSQWVYWIAPLCSGFIIPVFYKTVFCRKLVNR